MSTKQFAAQMKAVVADIKAKGIDVIPCNNLITYLDEVEKSSEPNPSPVEMEQYKANLQNWIASHRQVHESQLELFRSVITAGQGAIKSSFLLNGGAAVATLAFIGHIAQFNERVVPAFADCLVLFAYGVLAIAVTSGATYLSQWFYASTRTGAQRVGFWLNVLCILLGLASYGFFVWGLFQSYRVFATYA